MFAVAFPDTLSLDVENVIQAATRTFHFAILPAQFYMN
jgi:hypothetical protein